MKWIVYTPEYRGNSAGVRVMHRLTYLLNQCGEEAYGITDILSAEYPFPMAVQASPATDIAIYPEVVNGNPFLMKNICRYILNVPGLMEGPKNYPGNELLIYHSDILKEPTQAATPQIITDKNRIEINVIDPASFYPENEPRLYDCVYFGKWQSKNHSHPFPPIDNAIQITGSWPENRAETAKLLRGCRQFYCYDNLTAMYTEAAMCGAEVFILNGVEWVPFQVNFEECAENYNSKSLLEVRKLIKLGKDFFKGEVK